MHGDLLPGMFIDMPLKMLTWSRDPENTQGTTALNALRRAMTHLARTANCSCSLASIGGFRSGDASASRYRSIRNSS
jgi:hypothetical protein